MRNETRHPHGEWLRDAVKIALLCAFACAWFLLGAAAAYVGEDRQRERAKIGDTLCSMVEHRRVANLAVLRGPPTPLQLELLGTIGGDRFSDGAEALALCTKIDVTKIAACRATIPDPSCLIDVLDLRR